MSISAQAQLHIEATFYNNVTYTGILFNYRSFNISQSGAREQASRAMTPGMASLSSKWIWSRSFESSLLQKPQAPKV